MVFKAVVNYVGGLLASGRVFCWLPFAFFFSWSTKSDGSTPLNTRIKKMLARIAALESFGKVFLGKTKHSVFWGGQIYWVGRGNGYFCLGGTGFSANLSDKHLVPTSRYLRLGFLFSN